MALPTIPTRHQDHEAHRQRIAETVNGVTSFQFDDSRVRTGAEITDGVTPVNYAYAPGEVDRYGTNTTPGTTDMTAAFNAAFKVAKTSGHDVTYGRTWPYLVAGSIDVTCDAGADNYGFAVRCIGQMAAHSTNAPGYPSIIADHTGHIFDCSGAPAINWIDVSVGTLTSGSEPKTCWFLARNSGGGSQIHRFRHCRVIGKFSKAVVYNYGSENDQYEGCVFYNYSTTAGSRVAIWTASNVLSLSSTFITIATGNKPTTAHYINGGVWIHGAGGSTSDVLYLEGATSFNVDSPFMLCTDGAATRGRSLIYVDTTNGPTNLVHLKGIQSEYGSFTCEYGLYFGDTAATVSAWTIDGCNLSANTSKIFSHSGVVLDGFQARGANTSGGSPNINIVSTLQNSTIQDLETNITIGTSKDNNLFVSIGNLTVTTRDGDNWLGSDQSLTWTPGTGAVTHGGTLTISQKVVHYHGRQITVAFSIKDSISMSWAANAAITGLPATCIQGRGQVTVVNVDTGASIGNGSINGTSILLPALAAGGTNEHAITATYIVSA